MLGGGVLVRLVLQQSKSSLELNCSQDLNLPHLRRLGGWMVVVGGVKGHVHLLDLLGLE